MIVTKSPATKYTIRTPEGVWQASVLIDDEIGNISIQSDWGNFANTWSKPGRGEQPLRAFLVTCDSYYLCDKLLYQYHQLPLKVAGRNFIEKRLLHFLANQWPDLVTLWKEELAHEAGTESLA